MRASLPPALTSAIARRWIAAGDASGHRRVDGSLLFADVSGFTRLSESLARQGRAGAEEVVGLIGEVMTALVAEIEHRGGDVLLFAGDALVVLFEGADASARAADTAAAIRRWFALKDAISTSAGRVALRVSIGVASGPVDLVLAGGDEQGLFVAGPTASEMVRLERAAEAGEVLISEATAAALDPSWLGEPRHGGHLLARSVAPPAAPAVENVVPDGNELRLVPPAVRPLLEIGPLGMESDHRLATIGFVLASGLDAPLAATPDAVAADLDELYRTAAEACRRHGVTLLGPDATLDGVALFLAAGAPAATENNEERMLRVLRDVLDAPVAAGLRLRAGANRGPVFAGIVGAPHRATYTAMGDTTNLAARVANRAAPGELLATADVLARSGTEFEAAPADAFLPKGKQAPVVPYRVGAPTARAIRTPARLPLAGRGQELALLAARLADARAGHGSAVVIRGEPGVGKSRLVAEALGGVGPEARLEIRFAAGDEATPYLGIRGPLRELAGIAEDVGAVATAAGERLRAWALELAPSIEDVLPLAAIPFGVALPATPEVEGLAPEFRRTRMHEAVATLLGGALRPGSVILVEDLHWSDEASSALLEAVARQAEASGWLVLVLTRPLAEPFSVPDLAVIDLVGLDVEAAKQLALEAAGDVPLSDADLAAIVERAGGIPLFVRELAVLVAERGTASLPDRLESLLASRIDRLDGRHRALLRRAAVLGRTVDLDLLGEVLADEPIVRDLAAWSALDEFIGWVDQGRVRFRHDLFRTAAYEGLAVATRRDLHQRLAQAIEGQPGADLDELAAKLAHHYAEAGDHERAFAFGRRGGELARARYANIDAAALYRRAIDAALGSGSVPAPDLARVAEALGDVSEASGRYEDALSAYETSRRELRHAARAGAAASDEVAALDLARLDRKTGIVCERLGRYPQALTWYAKGAGRLPDAGDDAREALRIRLVLDRAGIRFRQGRYSAALELALDAADAADRIDDRALLAHAYYLLHAAYGDLGSPKAAAYRNLAVPIYKELGDLVGLGNALNNLGVEAYFEGRWDDALDLYTRSKAAKTGAGDVANAATQSNNEAEILSDQGHYAKAETLLRDALRVWSAAGYEIGIALATSNLGRVAARAGRHDEALAILEEAVGRFERIGAGGYVDETRARIAECLVLAGRADEAEVSARDALVRVRAEAETSILEAQLERTLGWCELLRTKPDAAAKHLEASLGVARALRGTFEVALTQRAMLQLPGLAGIERRAMEREAGSALQGLGVIAVAEPKLPE
jgi:class 3 adenylate cyclase/tetratricopeptide (TPR) repeat protein